MVGTRNRTINSFASNKPDQNKIKKHLAPQFKHGRAILSETNYSAGSSGSSTNSCTGETAYLNKPGHKSQMHYVNSHGSIFTLAANQYDSSQSGSSNQQVSYVQQTDVTSSGSCEGSSIEAANSNNYLLNQDAVGDHANSDEFNPDKNRHQHEQHRRLQYQVHQQLQRIYGCAPAGKLHNFRSCPDGGCSPHNADGARNGARTELEQAPLKCQKVLTSSLTERPYDSINLFNNFVAKANEENMQFDAEANDQGRKIIRQAEVAESQYGERRAQLDELHYATATAAALLNATANAAAVIAASAETQRQQKNQIDGIYSDPYQDDKRRQVPFVPQAFNMLNQKTRPFAQIDAPNLKLLRSTECEFRNQQSSMIYQPGLRANTQIYDLQTSPQQQQSRVPKHLIQSQHQQVYQSVNSNALRRSIPPKPPKPPARRAGHAPSMTTTANQVELIRQHQQRLLGYQRAQLQQMMPRMQTMPPRSIPAVAIVHSGANKAKANLKTELLSRMLLNNLAATQRLTGSPGNQLAIMDKSVTSLPSQFITDPRVGAIEAGHESIFPVATGPGGEARGAIMLRRSKEPVGFVERVCQLDLTLFWWSLLLVSLMFVGATVTISRYLY